MNINIKRNLWLLLAIGFSTSSCKKFLDIVPDNLPQIKNAFTIRQEAEKYLVTCYSYLPLESSTVSNPAFLGGDEMSTPLSSRYNDYAMNLPRGNQNVVNPYFNYWDGIGVPSMFNAIRDCNVFIENMSDLGKVPDIGLDERSRWIGEAMFLKAYYHFLLLRAYGPIPITDINIPVDAPADQFRVKRRPVDEVVNYIAALYDSAAARLPNVVFDRINELGRVTRPAALAMKAKALVLGASPLFNGNSDYVNFKNNDGALLVSTAFDAAKWKRAATACKEAILACEQNNIKLYTYPGANFPLTDSIKRQLSIRASVTDDDWNEELIWGQSVNGTTTLQRITAGHFDLNNGGNTTAIADQGPTYKVTQFFYSSNGVPINEDKILNFSNPSSLKIAGDADRFYITKGYTSARINFDREPRYYASLGFDGGIWYQLSSLSDQTTLRLETRSGGKSTGTPLPMTAYFAKKFTNLKFTWGTNTTSVVQYPWPTMRLADLYLLYAEALNESDGPVDEVHAYLDLIRARAGLKTVKESWSNYSSNPTKYTTKEGMRSIIRQERSAELALEGSRFWDLRRWKTAATELNGNVQGWDGTQSDPALYYRLTTYWAQRFVSPRDYLWPISENNLLVNENLVQNPGW
ncbi:RagB/SusD family nutrient uptake outer membrane protein [Niabella drilacis]|uniref:Starch-binding associating with outer membrane n=1 Tax=Niabella drilacis (strain DSM 25811 / CCM 8410 / CCUG 62505 / LMG 26954 / E90) TaxID=1285928 RepID=A0A1G7A5J3_NIADE|nr:RagB/SusD family nutrient uptake outer membrane protein [Niabella drilacis]SDE10119.1 Starch-binding associating with outer membrane [Niabella drilacis]